VPRKPGSQEEHPRAEKIPMEDPSDLYELTFSSLGPTGNVNILLDGKIISV
jgi:hypothetical protein